MAQGTFEIAIVVGIALFWVLVLLVPLLRSSKKEVIRRAVAEGRHRVITLEDRKFHAIRTTEIVLRSKSGRGRAVLVVAGRERDPDMVEGKLGMRPRWIKIRSLGRRGLSDHERWVSSKGWIVDGHEDIEYLIPFEQHEV